MRWISHPGWPGHLLALAAGTVTPLYLAPFDLWPLALVSLALFYFGLRHTTAASALCRGWWYGFGAFVAGTGWIYVSIHDYGGASLWLAGFLMLLFCAGVAFFYALPAWLWVRFLQRPASPLLDALTFAALWLLLEFFRCWFLTGFPWLYVGYSQLDGPLAGLAPLGGVWLISLTLAFTAALFVNLPQLMRHPLQLAVGLVLLMGSWTTGFMLKHHPWTTPAGESMSVAAIQGNIAQELKWDPIQIENQLQLYRDLTAEQSPVDIIVWPETAVPILQDQASEYLQDIDELSRSKQSALITGIPVRLNINGGQRFFNGITVLGEGSGTYLKQKLVPFGEYVPLQDYLRGLITFFDLPMSDFARGPSRQLPLQAHQYRIAPFICYEVVYPEFAASLAAHSNLLLTISNDAWFGRSIGPLQHLQIAQMRAMESGRWMIRATNNGVTALIDPFGQIRQRIPAFEQTILHGTIVPMQGLTPYLQYRAWPVAAFITVMLSWAVLGNYFRRRERRLFG